VSVLSAAVLCITYLAVLVGPGAAIMLAAGQRSWVTVFGATPVTYGVIGIFGPLLPLLGMRWSPLTMAAALLVLVALVYAARRVWRSRDAEPTEPTVPFWYRSRHYVLVGALLLTAVIGLVAMYNASAAFTAIPQWWDAGYHANAVRFIADTGNSAPGALRQFAAPMATSYFYPNGYHVLDATVYSLGHWPVPQVLDVGNGCQVGVFGLSMVGLVKQISGRPVLTIATGVLACAFTDFPYDVLVWGPLFPFAAAVAMLPAVLALCVRMITNPTVGGIAVAALAVVGLTAVHPSVMIAAAIMVGLYLAQRWITARRVPVTDLWTLGVFAVVTGVLGVFQLLGMVTTAGTTVDEFPPSESASEAVGQLITNSRSLGLPQWWLFALGVVGLFAIRQIAGLVWFLVGAGLFGVLFVFAVADGSRIVASLTAPWWGDSWRLAAIATIGLVLLAALGLTVIGDALAAVPWLRPARLAVFGVVLAVLLALTRGLYVSRNTQRLAELYPDGPVVSHQDVTAMRVLAGMAPPGTAVFNDPYDGSPWMLALDGLHPVFGEPLIMPQDAAGEGPQRLMLLAHLNQMDTDPAVRKALRDLRVQYVYLGGGFITSSFGRASGLRDLDTVHGLSLVYANVQARIYRVLD